MLNKQTFGKYSTEDYEYLFEIAEKAVVEGKGIHTEEIPKDVYYKIEQSSNEEANITFTCDLDKSGLINSPKMTITLSKKDKKILGKESIYQTEEDYKRVCNNQAKFFSVVIGAVCAIAIMVFYTMYSNIETSKPEK